ncbi:hypothetical protein Aduo_011779 [Ancylostoma duodenale]
MLLKLLPLRPACVILIFDRHCTAV